MIKLNLGCGWRNFGNDWVHIDGGNYEHLDSNNIIDLPYENNSVDLIYSSHVIEYFDRTDIESILSKWYSKLKPNGILRLAVPDFEAIVNLYIQNKITLSNALGPLYGKMPMGSETIYHKTTYDFIELKEILERCGFCNIKRYDWRLTDHSQFDDHSQAYIPHMDKENGTLISLNIECNKLV
jgi:predicted SAM-dependent methyltransferase